MLSLVLLRDIPHRALVQIAEAWLLVAVAIIAPLPCHGSNALQAVLGCYECLGCYGCLGVYNPLIHLSSQLISVSVQI